MNIIIPYRSEALNGLELKYSLRSIQKYLTGYKTIYLIGEKIPTWLINVEIINCHEQTAKLSKNIYDKILKAFEFREVGDKVIQWQDDIFLTQPLNVTDIKYWHEGTLEEAIESNHGHYKQYIVDTAMRITGDAKYFDIHTPIIYHKEIFHRLKKYDWIRKNLLIKSLYCHEAQVEGVEMQDCKLFQPIEKKDIQEKVKSMFFSTGPQGIDPAMVEVFEELYPEKSSFEK